MREWNVPGYAELKALGSGGFGDVVLARHDATGTRVAVKYLHDDLLSDPEFVGMFRGEATALASVTDPNVVRLYEYVESPSGAAIVMELVAGVSLREILARQGKTTAEAALVVLQGSLLGLAAAHRRGVVHRDYKPENVLVDGGGASKLTDFGIAARTGDRGIPAGTLAYAAPEQMAGAPASPASDVYAAAATFYECLTGRPPFSGGTAEALLRQHRSEPVPLDPVPEPLRPLLAAGMAKDPAHRPADAATLVTELETIASGAYGRDWADRGRSHLGEAALLLAALWPSGAPPAVQGTTVERIPLRERLRPRRPGDKRPPGRRRRMSTARAAIVGGVVVAVVAAGTAVAATNSHRPAAPSHPGVAVVRIPVRLKPAGPDIPITATSAFAPLTGDVYVKYLDGQDANAGISGEIKDVTSGEVVRLYAQPFPYASAPVPAGSVTLQPSGGTAKYAFQVTPSLATRYQVELFRNGTATTPLSISAVRTVYVVRLTMLQKGPGCGHPVCHEVITVSIFAPPSALNTEMSKRWYTYLGVTLSQAGEPAPPQSLQLGAGDSTVSQPQRVSADEFQLVVTYTFTVNQGGYSAQWHECSMDTETRDGVGLPGSHSCGGERIPASVVYLG